MVTLMWFNASIRTQAIIGEPPYPTVTVEAGISSDMSIILVNRNRSFRRVFLDLIHEFGHLILYRLGFDQIGFFHRTWDFINTPYAFFGKWDLWELWYGKDV